MLVKITLKSVYKSSLNWTILSYTSLYENHFTLKNYSFWEYLRLRHNAIDDVLLRGYTLFDFGWLLAVAPLAGVFRSS